MRKSVSYAISRKIPTARTSRLNVWVVGVVNETSLVTLVLCIHHHIGSDLEQIATITSIVDLTSSVGFFLGYAFTNVFSDEITCSESVLGKHPPAGTSGNLRLTNQERSAPLH